MVTLMAAGIPSIPGATATLCHTFVIIFMMTMLSPPGMEMLKSTAKSHS